MRCSELMLCLLLGLTLTVSGQDKIPYGNNPAAGKYIDVGNCKLYYEVYGAGPPLVMLHGGVYGYIDEFSPFIEKFSKKYQVICVGTRGHGKSEIGHTPFSWQQRAEDAYAVIRAVTKDSITLLGFSDGGKAAYKLAANHPELVKKLITIGAGDKPKGAKNQTQNYTPEMLLGQAKEYFEGRLLLMPEPTRWGECLSMLNKLYNEDFLSQETFSKIKCRTLVMCGEEDNMDEKITAARYILHHSISVIAGCGHVVFWCNFPSVWDEVEFFLNSK